MSDNTSAWDNLNMATKAWVIREAIRGGISTDLGEIKQLYNHIDPQHFMPTKKYDEGGSTKDNQKQPIVILTKYNEPLTLKEIPTYNRISIIDDYSDKFNYIVEGDKIYYSKKDRDYWVDISDNDKARKNLFNHINSKYKFKGYEDNEKELFDMINNGSFSYNNYHNLKNTSIEDTKLVDTEKKEVPQFVNILDSYKSPYDQYLNFNNHSKGPVSVSSQIQDYKDRYGIVELTEQQKQEYDYAREKEKEKQKEQVKMDDDSSLGILDKVRYLGDLAVSAYQRYKDKIFGNNETFVKEYNNMPDTGESAYGIIPASFTGDTIKISGDNRRYIIPENIDINEYTFGYRNRGDKNEIQSEGAPITAFHPFKPYGSHQTTYTRSGNQKQFSTYIGIDKDGNFKFGDISKFSDGDVLTGTFANTITSFAKDDSGNQIYESGKGRGSSVHNVPMVDYVTEAGEHKRGYINILLSKDPKTADSTYGNVTGGRVLVTVGDETRVLSGPLKFIEKEFEAMKERNNVDRGTFYTLDNGSYNRGLRTYDKKFTSEDLSKYDMQNTSGGNFLYIKDKVPMKFESDTIRTPNIRTTRDESYAKGHSTKNSLEGVLLHHTAFTGDDSMQGVTNHFLNKNSGASSHVVIAESGKRRIFADPEQVAFHAGHSKFGDRLNVNDFMLGIEFQGDTTKKPLTEEQIDSAVEYLAPIIRKYNIPLEYITTHEDVRDQYNKYVQEFNKTASRNDKMKQAPAKCDITQKEYIRIIEKLKEKIYYEKKKDNGSNN